MSTESIAKAFLLLTLSVALAITITAIQVSEAHADSCYAEDGSWIENCDTYFEPAPVDSDDGWLVTRWTPGNTDMCVVYVSDSDRTRADQISEQYRAQGYASTPVHYTPSLGAKTPACEQGFTTYAPLSFASEAQQSTPCYQDPKCSSEQARLLAQGPPLLRQLS